MIIFDTDLGGEYGNNLLYAGIKVHTTLTMGSLGYKKGLVTHDAWEEFVKQKVLKFIYTSCYTYITLCSWVPNKTSAEICFLKTVVCFFKHFFACGTTQAAARDESPVYSRFEKGCPQKPYATKPKGIMGNGGLWSLIEALGVSAT